MIQKRSVWMCGKKCKCRRKITYYSSYMPIPQKLMRYYAWNQAYSSWTHSVWQQIWYRQICHWTFYDRCFRFYLCFMEEYSNSKGDSWIVQYLNYVCQNPRETNTRFIRLQKFLASPLEQQVLSSFHTLSIAKSLTNNILII